MPGPEVGRPLPRAADAWVGEEKWSGWVLSDAGHGSDWRRAVGEIGGEELWRAIVGVLSGAVVDELRELGELGVTCRVSVSIGLRGRQVSARTVWHYADGDAAPRLVTAYPAT